MAFEALKKLHKPVFIISTEKNSVVSKRAKKLNVISFTGIQDKLKKLKSIASSKNYNIAKIFYVGNDLNDYQAMKLCGYSACPSDSHNQIKLICNICLNTRGGDGVIREIIEEIFNIDIINLLYK